MTNEEIIATLNEQISDCEGTVEAYKGQIMTIKKDVRDLKRAKKLLGEE